MRTKNNQRFNHDLFVSHSGADADWVQRLATHLKLEQWKVWIYEWDIQPAERWQDTLEKAIQTSRKLAVVLSPEAMKSPWVKLECEAMIDLAVSGDLRRFVPLLLKDCDIPLFVSQFQWIDFRDPHQFMIKLNELIFFLRGQPIPRDIKVSTDEWKPSTGQELRTRIYKILAYFDEIDMLPGFVCNWLELYWKDLERKKDKRLALIQRYAWPGHEEEGLRELLRQVERYAEQLGVQTN